ncbi:bifunctional methylenetetrahydrofolate dehydrogenase/methenyltetrahydrofolate cyclohydrolase FolD [Flammeovirgaceae bacterium SG7u.111]|nr:bifunctional methylenetetrahydrofolate dehydrogenase/methenyltetrahydrofolate cyclohydrolase FolD [Flammeovirgaceae bacterium SG7u.132]WPO34524.1 bifunctional methylenetetrahydrofolate dehydrogenase/methenyltetrahydrofolate cyclohydrolase FolD [Flammeovirgaceae bacterium SG7u.111]
MELIDGKKVSGEIKEEIAAEVKEMLSAGKRAPHLAAILVGNDGGSQTYVKHKMKACEQVGFRSTLVRYDDDVTEEELMAKIDEMNKDEELDGFIVQLPLPKHIDETKVTEAIDPKKDVDGFHPNNLGKMLLGIPSYLPATPYGIIQLLERYNIETEGKKCVIVGRSHIVGTPMTILMSRKAKPGNCTVTMAHSRTADLAAETRQADILVAALGKPEFITKDMVKEGAVVIDVGTTRVKDDTKKSGFALKGDVKFDEVSPKCSYITPVPGGVGPMTVVTLIKNTLLASKLAQA